MKNIFTKITIIIIELLLFVTCNSLPVCTKVQYITKFENFMSATEGNYSTYDAEAWKKANTQFKELSETNYSQFEKEMTTDERLKIDRLIGRYYSFVAKYQVTRLQEKLKRKYNQSESFIDNLLK